LTLFTEQTGRLFEEGIFGRGKLIIFKGRNPTKGEH
jgi:hypothetical protein